MGERMALSRAEKYIVRMIEENLELAVGLLADNGDQVLDKDKFRTVRKIINKTVDLNSLFLEEDE